MLGFAFDFNDPEMDNDAILSTLIQEHTANLQMAGKYIASLAGRHVILLTLDDQLFVFNDPGSLRSVYYFRSDNTFYLASQPTLIGAFTNLEQAKYADEFYKSKYYKKYDEYFLPAGITLFHDVHHLIPNHYLRVSDFSIRRFWPLDEIPELSPEEAVDLANKIMSGQMGAATKRYSLSLPVTAGVDSRYILAAAKDHLPDLFFYTLIYRNLTEESADIIVPGTIINDIGYQHHVLNCKYEPNEDFNLIFNKNYSPAHQTFCKIANGLQHEYPGERLCIKGVSSGIVKHYFSRLERRPSIHSGWDIAGYEPGWQKFSFITDHLDAWLKSAKEACENSRIDVLDLMYWEHRTGSWQAQSQNEWDMVMDQFTPYLNRPWLEVVFGTPKVMRSEPEFSIFLKMIDALWPELLNYPVNPPESWREGIVIKLRKITGAMGIYEPLRRFYTRLKY